MNQEIKKFTFENGFEIININRPDFKSEFATIMIDYGAADLAFDQAQYAGVAHFLEHKLFAKPEGDISLKFDQAHGEVNAATSTNKTMYFVNFVDHEFENINLLFEIISNPFFTNENVEKERQIISQELLMYQESPVYGLNQELMNAMFPNSSLKFDIGGTIESVTNITTAVLTKILSEAYQAKNMKLIVSGHLDFDNLVKNVEKSVKNLATTNSNLRNEKFDDSKIVTLKNTIYDRVNSAKFAIGLKFVRVHNSFIPAVIQEDLVEFMLDEKFGINSKWFNERYESGILTQEIETYASFERQGNLAKIFGQGNEIDQIIADVLKELKNHSTDKIVFENKKKEILAQSFRTVDQVSNFAFDVGELAFSKLDYFQIIKELQQLTFADYQSFIEEIMSTVQITVVKLLPGEK